MKQIEKKNYECPKTEIIEVKHEGILCASGENPDGYWSW